MREDEDIISSDLASKSHEDERIQQATKSRMYTHSWLPHILGVDSGNLTDVELEALLKKTKWLDRLTDNEYKYFFDRDGLSNPSSVKYRLKNKIRDWLMVISTLWSFDDKLYFKVQMEAKEIYEAQTGRDFFLVEYNEED
jgi:hypothetical protein